MWATELPTGSLIEETVFGVLLVAGLRGKSFVSVGRSVLSGADFRDEGIARFHLDALVTIMS